eukprot:m.200469 g.200469  ORF g.200469 m.200469 type:complete len:65 (-) comp15736_c0_seq4:929-1123(-)
MYASFTNLDRRLGDRECERDLDLARRLGDLDRDLDLDPRLGDRDLDLLESLLLCSFVSLSSSSS